MRFALIRNGEIVNVVRASQRFIDTSDPAWRAQYDEIREVPDGVVAEPGGRVVGASWQRASQPQPTDRIADLESRIATLEAARSQR